MLKMPFAYLLLPTALIISGCSTTPKAVDLAASDTPTTEPAPAQEGFAQKERERLAAEQLAQEKSLENERLFYFAFDSDVLPTKEQQRIAEHASYLIKHPDTRLRLEGHADERGSREYNIALGERRARSIERALYLRGVARAQVSIVSYGEERPAVYGAQREDSFAKNRRVEFNYLTGSLASAPLSYENPIPADEAMSTQRTPRVSASGS